MKVKFEFPSPLSGSRFSKGRRAGCPVRQLILWFPSPLSGSRFSKRRASGPGSRVARGRVSIPFKRVSVFKEEEGTEADLQRGPVQVSIPFKRVSVFKVRRWRPRRSWPPSGGVSIPFKRVSVFKGCLERLRRPVVPGRRFPSPLSGSRFSKWAAPAGRPRVQGRVSIPFKRVSVFKALYMDMSDAEERYVSIPFKRVSVFKGSASIIHRPIRCWFPSPLSGSRFSKPLRWFCVPRTVMPVSIPFKRVSVFKALRPAGPCCPSGDEFPSPLSGSRFSKRIVTSTG